MNTRSVGESQKHPGIYTLKEVFPHLYEKEDQNISEKRDEWFSPIITGASLNGQVIMEPTHQSVSWLIKKNVGLN